MKEKLNDEQNAAILKALNKAIEDGPWDSSNFLRILGKKLVALRDDFIRQLGSVNQAHQERYGLEKRVQLRDDQQEVYISLYSADGGNIQSWEKIIANLPRQVISRPIYAHEENIKEVLKLKSNKVNEAYVTVYINKSDILTTSVDRVLVDKLGNSLLSLKDKSVQLDNIFRFIHCSGIYRLSKGRLEKIVSDSGPQNSPKF